jgi:hypothetical protein
MGREGWRTAERKIREREAPVDEEDVCMLARETTKEEEKKKKKRREELEGEEQQR